MQFFAKFKERTLLLKKNILVMTVKLDSSTYLIKSIWIRMLLRFCTFNSLLVPNFSEKAKIFNLDIFTRYLSFSRLWIRRVFQMSRIIAAFLEGTQKTVLWWTLLEKKSSEHLKYLLRRLNTWLDLQHANSRVKYNPLKVVTKLSKRSHTK